MNETITPAPTAPSTESALNVQNLSVEFVQGSHAVHAVKDLSFVLAKGQTTAIVGESGSGKSVTAHSILRLLPYPAARHADQSRIEFHQHNLLQVDTDTIQSVRGNRIGMIFQEPMTALNPLHTVETQVGEVLRIHQNLAPDAIRATIVELLESVDLPEPKRLLTVYPHQLSGGQRQRVMIAMALANQPDILIADEPTTALDVFTEQQVMDLLMRLQSERALTLLLITHDLSIVRKYADHVVVMQNGECVEHGPLPATFDAPQHGYTQALLHTTPKGPPPSKPKHNEPPVLTVNQLNVFFPKKKNFFGHVIEHYHAVKDIDLKVAPGETVGIVGESGSGKTTLVQAVLRLLSSQGNIIVDGQPWHTFDQKQLQPLRHNAQMVFQDPFASLSPRLTIEEIVGEGLLIHGHPRNDEWSNKVAKALEQVDLDASAIRNRYPHEFSGGQRQRIAIARALVMEPTLLIFDEPTSALDRAVQVQVVELIQQLQCQLGFGALFISHDLEVVRALSHRLCVLKDGIIIEKGDTESIIANPAHEYTKLLIETLEH